MPVLGWSWEPLAHTAPGWRPGWWVQLRWGRREQVGNNRGCILHAKHDITRLYYHSVKRNTSEWRFKPVVTRPANTLVSRVSKVSWITLEARVTGVSWVVRRLSRVVCAAVSGVVTWVTDLISRVVRLILWEESAIVSESLGFLFRGCGNHRDGCYKHYLLYTVVENRLNSLRKMGLTIITRC